MGVASAFTDPAYLMLVRRIGASSAAYVLVATPILALGLSSAFEGYQWAWTGVAGIAVIALANVLVLTPEALVDRILCATAKPADSCS